MYEVVDNVELRSRGVSSGDLDPECHNTNVLANKYFAYWCNDGMIIMG